MKPEQISTWIGIATAFAGVVASFVTMETKLTALEGKMSELYNVDEIRTMEKRLTTLEVTQSNSSVGALSATIATLEGQIKNVETKVSGIKGVDSGKIEGGISVNKSRIQGLESEIERNERSINSLRQKLATLNSNPLR